MSCGILFEYICILVFKFEDELVLKGGGGGIVWQAWAIDCFLS